MAASLPEQIRTFARGIGVRQVRLVSGVILFCYLVSHFLNHALGNVSMEALAGGVYYHTLFWQFLPVAVLFYTAALVHTGLGIWALYERRQFLDGTQRLRKIFRGRELLFIFCAHDVWSIDCFYSGRARMAAAHRFVGGPW